MVKTTRRERFMWWSPKFGTSSLVLQVWYLTAASLHHLEAPGQVKAGSFSRHPAHANIGRRQYRFNPYKQGFGVLNALPQARYMA
jgi:hypothetical protein